jgi:hypothetical protein
MDSKYHIILFKNNKKKKKLKSFVRENLANEYYKKLISKSNEIIFDKKFENGHECRFFLGVVSDKYVSNNIHYLDEFGRNKSIDPKIDDENYIQKIELYKLEESIFDVKNDTKITIDYFIKNYIKDKLYLISQIKNKFVLQNDDDFSLFSLKNEEDCERFLTILSSLEVKSKLMIVRDVSQSQRKYLYNLLIEKGFNKKFLYTSFTTYPK